MRYEMFIARRLKLNGDGHHHSPTLNVALIGIFLAIVIMILAIAIVMGFKKEISGKIYQLEPHIKVMNAALGLNDNYATVNVRDVREYISAQPELAKRVGSISLMIDQPAILKTDSDFKAVQFRGVDDGYDFSHLRKYLVDGRMPVVSDTSDVNEVAVSRRLANELRIHTGDRLPTYFIEQKVKVRNSRVVGIFDTYFETFDNAYIVGNISQLQGVNDWNKLTGTYVGVNMTDEDHTERDAMDLFSALATGAYTHSTNTLYTITHTRQSNMSFFVWLNMLDMNVIIILALMMVVAGFTLVTAMLMIVLERVRMVGQLKALGATNGSIRQIVIYLTGKLVLKAMLLGNFIGIAVALAQKWFHIVRLDADSYYMSYVPIHLDVWWLLALNVGIVVVSYLTLLAPSHIISTIKPTTTMRFE